MLKATKVEVVSGGDLLENDPTFHSDLDRNSFVMIAFEAVRWLADQDAAFVMPEVTVAF